MVRCHPAVRTCYVFEAVAVLAIVATLSLAACSSTTYQPVAPTLPPRPVLEPVPAAALACLADDTYRRLVLRDQALKAYAAELEDILNALGDE